MLGRKELGVLVATLVNDNMISYEELKRSQGTGTHKHTETESNHFPFP